jgi:toxin-antitoxin system PIN domain toxin
VRALFDVNALIALLHFQHTFHPAAFDWWTANSQYGWASCPITENGLLRIMSNPRYSAFVRFSVGEIGELIGRFVGNSDHEFWPDDISLIDKQVFDSDAILGPLQITDVYLLGLAAKNNGRLVTFDQSISASAVRNAHSHNLVVL